MKQLRQKRRKMMSQLEKIRAEAAQSISKLQQDLDSAQRMGNMNVINDVVLQILRCAAHGVISNFVLQNSRYDENAVVNSMAQVIPQDIVKYGIDQGVMGKVLAEANDNVMNAAKQDSGSMFSSGFGNSNSSFGSVTSGYGNSTASPFANSGYRSRGGIAPVSAVASSDTFSSGSSLFSSNSTNDSGFGKMNSFGSSSSYSGRTKPAPQPQAEVKFKFANDKSTQQQPEPVASTPKVNASDDYVLNPDADTDHRIICSKEATNKWVCAKGVGINKNDEAVGSSTEEYNYELKTIDNIEDLCDGTMEGLTDYMLMKENEGKFINTKVKVHKFKYSATSSYPIDMFSDISAMMTLAFSPIDNARTTDILGDKDSIASYINGMGVIRYREYLKGVFEVLTKQAMDRRNNIQVSKGNLTKYVWEETLPYLVVKEPELADMFIHAKETRTVKSLSKYTHTPLFDILETILKSTGFMFFRLRVIGNSGAVDVIVHHNQAVEEIPDRTPLVFKLLAI